MKIWSIALLMAFALVGCGRNKPGTMGGEPGGPETVATGAPAQAAKETSRTDRNQPGMVSEHSASTYDDQLGTNNQALPKPDPSRRRNE